MCVVCLPNQPDSGQRRMLHDKVPVFTLATFTFLPATFLLTNIFLETKSMTQMKKVGLFALVWMSAWAAQAQDANIRLQTRALVASCAGCHGTDGRAVEGSSIPSLAGSSKADITMQMKAFKEGTRPATIMHQLSKGYTDEQIDRISTYFAAIKR